MDEQVRIDERARAERGLTVKGNKFREGFQHDLAVVILSNQAAVGLTGSLALLQLEVVDIRFLKDHSHL